MKTLCWPLMLAAMGFLGGCGASDGTSQRSGQILSEQPAAVTDEMGLSAAEGMSPEGPIVANTNRQGDQYWVGTGLADVTGPASGKMMQGYVNLRQTSAGIHTRLWSRAFVIADTEKRRRVVIVTADLAHIFQSVQQAVVERVRTELGNEYDFDNVLLTATHTHSGPGGYGHDVLYNLSSMGYSPQNFRIVVDGIVESIRQAHASLRLSKIKVANGMLPGANINRSPEAYAANPAAERAQYATDTNQLMTVLGFYDERGEIFGMLSWFGVHATTVERGNRFIDSDNKGYASYLIEQRMHRDYRQPEGFVAAFAQAEAGDVSPNVSKDLDGDGDWDCPANTDLGCSTFSGGLQAERAWELLHGETTELSGPIDTRYRTYDMSQTKVEALITNSGQAETTCYAAIGLSMLAGAPEDGPGIGSEGSSCGSLGPILTGILCRGTVDERCHGKKPIAVALGKMTPHPWTPEVLPLQIVRLGNLAITAVPAEFSTMSGRRIRHAVQQVLGPIGIEQVVLAGYANSYAGYVTTREEYELQYYEGASTHFGPWTQAAYQQGFGELAESMARQTKLAPGPVPRDLRPTLAQTEKIMEDRAPLGASFGDVRADAQARYAKGETVKVEFIGSNLNANLKPAQSIAWVEQWQVDQWQPVRFDWDVDTYLTWENIGLLRSIVSFEWQIPANAQSGKYRIVYESDAHPLIGQARRFKGVSREFEVR